MSKLITVLFIFFALAFTSCIRDPNFTGDEWWTGHWESVKMNGQFFSSGYKNHSFTFYFSTLDTITSEYAYLATLESNDRKRWKLIKTYDGKFIKIADVEAFKMIEIFGPSDKMQDLQSNGNLYMYKKNFIHPIIPDSLIYGN